MGSNADGRLGIGEKNIEFASAPCMVESLYMQKPYKISCGWGHTAVTMGKQSKFIFRKWGLL
jgi:hypothetical protein